MYIISLHEKKKKVYLQVDYRLRLCYLKRKNTVAFYQHQFCSKTLLSLHEYIMFQLINNNNNNNIRPYNDV